MARIHAGAWYLYADGRLIWIVDSPPSPDFSFVEQRLTPEGCRASAGRVLVDRVIRPRRSDQRGRGLQILSVRDRLGFARAAASSPHNSPHTRRTGTPRSAGSSNTSPNWIRRCPSTRGSTGGSRSTSRRSICSASREPAARLRSTLSQIRPTRWRSCRRIRGGARWSHADSTRGHRRHLLRGDTRRGRNARRRDPPLGLDVRRHRADPDDRLPQHLVATPSRCAGGVGRLSAREATACHVGSVRRTRTRGP